MGILSRSPIPYIGFPSSYISGYFTSAKFEFPLIASIIIFLAVYETCFRDRGIDLGFLFPRGSLFSPFPILS